MFAIAQFLRSKQRTVAIASHAGKLSTAAGRLHTERNEGSRRATEQDRLCFEALNVSAPPPCDRLAAHVSATGLTYHHEPGSGAPAHLPN